MLTFTYLNMNPLADKEPKTLKWRDLWKIKINKNTRVISQTQKELELRKKRRDGFLAAISREDLDLTVLHKYKVCERHFHSGKSNICKNVDEKEIDNFTANVITWVEIFTLVCVPHKKCHSI